MKKIIIGIISTILIFSYFLEISVSGSCCPLSSGGEISIFGKSIYEPKKEILKNRSDNSVSDFSGMPICEAYAL
ncbi:MAG: hypothetical protein Q9M97_10130 [Candidatus Gracilibacteria bacterium]|nr:hypothetical protein [Candidatus Gracilibacteria bacterium]